MLNRYAKTADERKKRHAKVRRRKLTAEMRRYLQLEPLEDRRLLASDVVVGLIDNPAAYVRTPDVSEVVYSPLLNSAEIAVPSIVADLNAGLTVRVNAVNAAGTEEGNITIAAAGLSLSNAVNATLEIQADDDVVVVNSRLTAPIGSGNLVLNAGDDFSVAVGASVIAQGTGQLAVNLDQSPNADAGTGSTATIAGSLSGNGGTSINGGTDAETFKILAAGSYSIFAGDPAASPGDTLVVDGNGGQVNVTPTQVITPTATIDISGIDDISITNTAELFVDGPMSGIFTVMAVPASTLATIAVSPGPTITYDTVTATALINGSEGDDTLILDLSGGLIADNFDFRPGGNVNSNPGDQIRIVGTPPILVNSLTFDYIDEHSGFINIDGVTSVVYRDLEPITSTIDAAEVTLNYTGVSETITVTQLGSDITVDSTAGEITTFVAPTDRFSIGTGGGADTITVDGLNVDLATGFDVGDLDSPSDDTLTFLGTATNVATGVIDLTIATIDLQVDVTAGSRITLGPTAPGPGEIRLPGQLSAGGDVDLNRKVVLSTPTTVIGGATSDVLFSASVDGAHPLAVDSGSIRFLGPVGDTTPLTSFTATGSASGILIGDNVTTVGEQTYNSPVTISPATSTVTTTSIGGRIDFLSTIDAGVVPGGSLIIDTDDVVTFGDAIGGNATLNDLIVSMAGDLTIAHDITVAGSIDITTADSGTDNLVVQSPAILTAGPTGLVTLNADDDINIQAGATINALNLNLNVDNVSLADDPGVGSTVLVNGTLNIGGSTAVTGADDADTFVITPQSGSSFAVVGGNPITSPGDSLIIDAGGADVTVDVATGSITVAGSQPIAPSGIERVDLSNTSLLTISGDSGADTVSIARDPSVVGGDLLTINGVAAYALVTVRELVFNGGGGDDSLTFDASGGAPTTPVTFNGQGQAGASGGDKITVIGSFNTQTLNYTAPGADGNDGTIDLDGTVITYTGLEPINAGNSSDTILNFNSGLANSATLRDAGTSDNGMIEIIDNGATFEDTVIPNPTNSLTINLGDQGDSLTVNTLDAAYAASMVINGGAGADDVQLNSVTISNTPGRGLDVAGVEVLGITDSTFSGNTADVGGGLRVIGGTATIDNSTFSDNTATGDAATQGGGGIFNNAGTLIVTGGTISNNTASGRSGSGGGIMSLGGTVNITGGLLESNTATIDGGGLFASGAGSVTMTDARILRNVAGDSGGGALINGPTTTILRATFTANEAQGNLGLDGDGGGLFVRGQTGTGDFILTASDFDSNTALSGGGGAFFVDISGAIDGGNFSLNQVTGNGTTFDSGGGGLVIVGETLVTAVSISGVTVDGNTAPSAGGVGIVDSAVTILNSVISNNVATDLSSGAGGIGALATVTLSGDLLSLESSRVVNNTTAGEGGGLGIINGDISVFSTTISGNQATGGRGGGVGLLNNGIAGTATFDSATISMNTASESGGGIATLNFGLDLQNVTISTNDAGTVGGGIAYENNVSAVTRAINFSTITSNTAAAGGSNVAATGSPIDVRSSIFSDGVVAATGVLNSLGNNLDSGNTAGFGRATDLNNTDPLLGPLQDNGGVVFTHLLLTGSPAIDGGGATGPATDARGFTRPTDGDGDGSVAFDIGAIEAGQGNVLVVDLTADIDDGDVTAGNVSLREAVRLANADPDATRITFNPAVFNSPQVITLAGTALAITEDVMIDGPGSELLTIDGNDGSQLFTVSGSTTDATIQFVTLIGGNGVSLGGGAIDNTDANLTIEASVISGNRGESGGGINNRGGNLDVSNSTLFGNEAIFPGGGIASYGGAVTVTDSSISSNKANYYGGGISSSGGSLTITGTTIANNSAIFDGGGILSDRDSSLTIINSTVSGNTSDGSGGGLKIGSDGSSQYDSATITNVTITGNVGGGVAVGASADQRVAISNSIVAGNRSNVGSAAAEFVLASSVGLDLANSVSNLIADPASAGGLTNGVSGNIVGDGSGGAIPIGTILDPALSDNGGPTLTHALVPGSPAIDAADPDLAPSVDQRGKPRPIDGDRDNAALEDIGSFEAEPVARLTMSDVVVDEGDGMATVTVLLSDDVAGGFMVDFATSDESATDGEDYESVAGTLTFDGFAGETQTFTVRILDDLLVEPTESFSVSLFGSSESTVNFSGTAIITITDNDSPGVSVDIGVSIDDTPDPVLIDGDLIYTITITNFSSNTATGVVSTTTLPVGLTGATADATAGTVNVNGNIVTASIPSLAAGAAETITITATAPGDAGRITVNTDVAANEADTNGSNNALSEATTVVLPTSSPTITGNVFCDIDDDSRNDPGEEVTGTLVFIDANDNGRFDSGEPSTTTNANGGYQFANVTGQSVNVSVMVPPSCNTIPNEPSVRRSVIPVGNGARSITTADTDNDGDRDLLVASDFSNSLTIVENTSNGFVRGSDIPLGDRPQSVFAHESGFSASHLLTIAVAGIGTPADGGAVYTIDGQGSPVRHAGTAGPMDVIVADLDNDGLHDVLSASFRESFLELRLGSGDVLSTTSLSQQILSIASGDLVAPDVTQEVVVSGFGFGQPTKLEVFGLDSSGGVARVDSIDTAPSIVEVSVERIIDSTAASPRDEIVALYSSGKIIVYPMLGGQIGAGIETSIMPGASAFDFGDFNRDGITDVAVANLGGQFIELYTGSGDGRFALVTTVRNVSAPSDLVVDDFNADGFDDIAVANFYSDANIDDPTLPPAFSWPSTSTVLYFEIASRSITVTSNTVATEDFVFPSADPEVILDTSRDNRVTALDALRVINVLNRQAAAEGEQGIARAATDVNGDGLTSAVDALMIINYLNRETPANSINVSIDDLIPGDDDEDGDELIAAIDFVLTQNLV